VEYFQNWQEQQPQALTATMLGVNTGWDSGRNQGEKAGEKAKKRGWSTFRDKTKKKKPEDGERMQTRHFPAEKVKK